MIKVEDGHVHANGSVCQLVGDCLLIVKSFVDDEQFYKDLIEVEIKDDCKDKVNAKAIVKFVTLVKELKEMGY